MSLDISLIGIQTDVPCVCSCCAHKHTRKESEEFFSANITHNLNLMASEAGIYNVLWRPEESGVTTARELIEPLRKGIALMESNPARFEKHNAKNGWGTREQFIPWLTKLLTACEEYPNATLEVSR